MQSGLFVHGLRGQGRLGAGGRGRSAVVVLLCTSVQVCRSCGAAAPAEPAASRSQPVTPPLRPEREACQRRRDDHRAPD